METFALADRDAFQQRVLHVDDLDDSNIAHRAEQQPLAELRCRRHIARDESQDHQDQQRYEDSSKLQARQRRPFRRVSSRFKKSVQFLSSHIAVPQLSNSNVGKQRPAFDLQCAMLLSFAKTQCLVYSTPIQAKESKIEITAMAKSV